MTALKNKLKKYKMFLLLGLFVFSIIAVKNFNLIKVIRERTIFAQLKNLQIDTFKVSQENTVTINQAWLKECKPAIYLYPLSRRAITVKVEPLGRFTYLDPVLENEEWNVVVDPDGTFKKNNKTYSYLYYESALKRQEVKIPTKGYVIKKAELDPLFSRILPVLGLNSIEEKDFRDYWGKSLPESPYYFVGLVDRSNIDYTEKLSINPSPDSIIRIRFFFKPVDYPYQVDPPVITKQVRYGFSVVEWGGIVDRGNKEHICSQ